MNRKLFYTVAALAAGLIALNEGCKKKEEAAANSEFSLIKTTFNEGDTIMLVSSSTNAKTLKWTFSGSAWSSTNSTAFLPLDSAGTFQINLETKNGDGKGNVKSMTITVQPDTIWRLSGNSSKVWIVESLTYNSSEMLTASCQKDDEFTVIKTSSSSTDSCTLTEGTNTCPSGTYLITLPMSSKWRIKDGKFEFSIVALSTPMNLSFTMDKCTKTEFEGTDSKNSVTIKLKRK